METRASYILVGVFTLLAIIGALAFVLWTAGRGDGRSMSAYDVHFTGNVMGLSVASDVFFNGVKVGAVKQITLDPDDPARVKVRIQVDASTPVREDSVASLEGRGLTGVSVVQITGGSPHAPLLAAHDGRQVPVIASRASRLEELFAGMPQLVGAGNELLNRLADVLNAENRAALAATFHALDTVSARMAARADNLDRIIINMDMTTRRLANASAGLEGLTGDMRDLMNGDVRRSVVAVGETARRIDAVASAAQPGLTSFSTEGLEDMRRLLIESRQLVGTLNRLAQRMESDPRRFMFGNPLPEYEDR